MKLPRFLIVLTALAFAHSNRAGAELVSYTYDAAGRLSGVSYSGQAKVAYVYDGAGNIISRVVSAVAQTPGALASAQGGDTGTVAILAAVPPLGASSGPSARAAVIQWKAIPGKTYRLQYKNDLSDPAWMDVPGDVTASNSLAFKNDSSASPARRFYRILVLP